MKKLFFTVAAAFMALASFCESAAASDLKTQSDSLAYYFGKMWGNGVGTELRQSPKGQNFDNENVLKGVKVVLSNDSTQADYLQGIQIGMQMSNIITQLKEKEKVTIDFDKVYDSFKVALGDTTAKGPGDAQKVVMQILNEIQTKNRENSPEAIANKGAGEKYIKDMMAKDAAFKKTESGLVYKVIAEGKGECIKDNDRAKVKYVGKHIDGTEFDNSKGEARVFGPSEVIAGFGEGLRMMKPGAHFILLIPGELGYGIQGQPYAKIEPNETLVFDVEVVGLEEKK